MCAPDGFGRLLGAEPGATRWRPRRQARAPGQRPCLRCGVWGPNPPHSFGPRFPATPRGPWRAPWLPGLLGAISLSPSLHHKWSPAEAASGQATREAIWNSHDLPTPGHPLVLPSHQQPLPTPKAGTSGAQAGSLGTRAGRWAPSPAGAAGTLSAEPQGSVWLRCGQSLRPWVRRGPRLQAVSLRAHGGTLQAGRPEPRHSPAVPWGGGGSQTRGLACSPCRGLPAAPQGFLASVSVSLSRLSSGAGHSALAHPQEESLPVHLRFRACLWEGGRLPRAVRR